MEPPHAATARFPISTPRPIRRCGCRSAARAHVCTPRTCGTGTECFYQNARKEAEAARVVVLNHSLFFNFLAGRRR